jgi:hypothetical protein
MKKLLSSFLVIAILLLIIEVSHTGCANIIPPSGGPRDSLPPQLISAIPKDSSFNTQTKKIVLTFDEYVEVKGITENLVVSPLPKNMPFVESKLKTVTIKLKDSLEPNTTYTFDFGNSIVDINEGNPSKNFTYTFSTGNTIDSNSFSGKVVLAETGKVDSTLIAVLYKNTNDTAVFKERPRYIAKLNGDGTFKFKNLPKGNFALFAIENDYTKKYDDSTKTFAFADSLISIGSNNKAALLYAYKEAKKISPSTSSTNNNAGKSEADKDKRLKYSINLESGRQDILKKELEIEFSRKIKKFDSTKLLLCDTNFNRLTDYSIQLDSTKKKLIITKAWVEKNQFRLILQKDVVTDTTNTTLAKNDTLRFATKNEADYGSIKIRFNNLDTAKHPVLLIFKETTLIESIKIIQRDFTRKLFNPGEYEIKILFDKNNNGIWDAGNFKQKKQPEIVRQLGKKLSIRANWDNETEIGL